MEKTVRILCDYYRKVCTCGAMWCHVVPWSVGVCGAIVCWRMWCHSVWAVVRYSACGAIVCWRMLCHSVWAVVRYSACGAIVCGAIVCCGVMCGAVVQCISSVFRRWRFQLWHFRLWSQRTTHCGTHAHHLLLWHSYTTPHTAAVRAVAPHTTALHTGVF